MPHNSELAPVEGLRFRMTDGVELRADAWGDPERRPALLLHGGGQTRHAWKGTAASLAQAAFYAVSIDQRGHGQSGWSPDGDYAIDRFVSDLRTVAGSFDRKPLVIGASLGGVAALLAEGEADRSIASALVLVDITPRVDPDGVARIRGFMRAHVEAGFGSLEEVADAIAAYLPHRPRPKSLGGLTKNLRHGADGRYRWHWDPAFVQGRDRDPGYAADRLMNAARRLSVPVLLVRGGASELVTEEAAREFVSAVPGAEYVDVHGARHMVAGDVNDEFTNAVMGFLSRLE
jgi:pimeloyl-ACP methyl ester carboxylesterase